MRCIFVKAITLNDKKLGIMEHFKNISGLTERNIKLIAIEVADLEVSVFAPDFMNFLSVRVQELLFFTKMDMCFVCRKCHYLIYNQKAK